MPSGPSSHFWAGDRVDVGARSPRGRRGIAPDALRAVDDDERAARVGDLGDAGDRQDRAGRPQHVRDDHEPRLRSSIAASKAARRPRVVAAVADVDEVDLDPEPGAQVVQRPDAARVLEARRHGPVAGSPVDRPARRCSCRRSSSGSARCPPASAVSTAATAARASAIRWRVSGQYVDVGPPGR